jgi:pre-mRNA-splicing factor SYF1
LEESLGTVETAKAAYDKILELRIANAQIIVNCAAFLEENKYFEESFKVGQSFLYIQFLLLNIK